MNLKNYVVIFSLIIVLMCCISTVSAVPLDTIDNITSGIDQFDSVSVSNVDQASGADDFSSASVAQENDVGLLAQSPTEVIADDSNSSSAGNTSYVTSGDEHELINLIENTSDDGTLTLDKDYIFTGQLHDDSSIGISINKAITIDGQGHKIDANNYCTIFAIDSPNIVLTNIYFLNGHVSDDYSGGALGGGNPNLSIVNCTFENNIATDNYNAGAIAIMGDNISIVNSLFESNIGYGMGGAITIRGNDITISDCTFRNNRVNSEDESETRGGAINIEGENGNILNCEFNNNYADLGSDIFIFGNSETFMIENYSSDAGESGIYFDDGSGDNNIEVIIFIDEEKNFPVTGEDVDDGFVAISLPDYIDGTVIIFGGESEFFNKRLSDFTDDKKGPEDDFDDYIRYVVSPQDVNFFEGLNDEDEIEIAVYDDEDNKLSSKTYMIFFEEDTIRFEGVGGDDADDADDGVVIWVNEGDFKEFDLNNDDDLNDAFAYVSVSNDLDGTIVFYCFSPVEGEEQDIFHIDLSEIGIKYDDEMHDGFTIHELSFNSLGGTFDDFKELNWFRIAFVTNYGESELCEVDSSSYNIEVDGEDDNIIRFWKDNGGDEPSGEGDKLEGVEFRSANAQNNDVVIVIPMANFPEDITNEFTVIVLTEEDEIHTNLKLDELDHDDSSYYIRVNDLYIDDVEIGEGTGMDIIVQFYDADDKPIYYAHESIGIFNSPYIFEEASILSFSDDVITFQEVPEGVDEFTVTIQKEGEDSVVKTFKFSELGNQYEDEEDEDEEGGVWYALTLSDLGINETGDYQITVKFSEELTYSGTLSVTRKIDVRIHNEEEEWDEESEPALREFTSVDELVAVMRFAENIKGSVNLAIGENDPIVIDFADLKYDPSHPPHNGRQILLNDLKITESGTYTINMTIYDENGELMYEDEFDLLVTVGDNNVEFNDAYYTAEIFDFTKFTISTHLSSGQYYNIYFNGELAGKYSTDGIVITNNKFYDIIWGDGEDDDVKFIKYGDYDVNVTFFDGENESATLFTGNFSIKSLNMATDKDSYYDDEDVTIIFDAQEADGYYPVLYVEYAKGWGYMGPFFDDDWEMAFAGEEVAELIKDGKFTVNIGKLPAGTNYIYAGYYLYDSKDAYHEDDDAVFRFYDLMPIIVSAPVELVDPALTISVDNISEGASAVVTITTNATFNGDVLVKIGNDNYTVTVANGTGYLSVSGLAAGTYNATAIFEATDLFIASTKNTTFTVNKLDTPEIGIAVSGELYEGSDVIVNVSVDGATGNVTVNGIETALVDGKASVTLSNVSAGDLTIDVVYSGDDKFESASNSVNVTVNAKKDAGLDASASDINVGDDAVIIISIDKDATGNVTVDGVVVSIVNGGGEYKVSDLAAGNYSYVVKFAGDNVFNGDEATVTFTVSKLASMVKVDVGSEFTVGDSFIINVTNSTQATVTVNGKEYSIKADGSVDIDTTVLAAGNYTVVASIAENEKYLANESTATFTVSKLDAPEIGIAVSDELYEGSDVIVNVSVDGATGNVTVNGKVKALVDGKASVTLSNVSAGDLTIDVVYSGDDKFESASNSVNVTVNAKKDAGLNASASDINVGDDAVIIISIDKDATGNVTVDGVVVSIVNGSGEYKVSDLAAGNYSYVVKFAGDNVFNGDEATVTFTVSKLASMVKVDVGSEFTVGDSFIINVTNSTQATVTVNGKEYSIKADGSVDIDTTVLAAGNYTVVASIAENEKYLANESTATFTINAPAPITDYPVKIENTTDKNTATLTVTLPEDATGTVAVSVGDANYTADVKDGKASIVVNDLPAGSNEVKVSYSGDSKYAPYSASGVIIINKKETLGTVIVLESVFTRYATDWDAGERGAMFYGTLYDVNKNPLVNKTVQISVNGPIYNVTTDSEGKAGLQVNLAKANTYTYALLFYGDEEYKASPMASTKLTVIKKPTSIIANNMAFKTSAKTKTVTVALNTIKNPYDGKFYLNKGKKLTLTVNGKTYTAKTGENGVANFNIKINKKGTYTATIKFAGDNTYESTSKTIKITISNSPSKNSALKGVGTGTTPKDIDAGGSLNIEGNYSQYLENTTTSDSDAIKKDTVIVVEQSFSRVANDFNAGERGDYFYATLTDSDGNPLYNKTVQIAVNGPVYEVQTDKDGKAGLQVNLAKANTYTYALSFSGDDQYNPAPIASSKLTVTKKTTSISASAKTFKASAKTKTVSVTLKTSKNPYDGKTYLSAGKKLTLKVNGKTYTAKIDKNGVAKFNIKLTKKGKHTATISFAGDSTYKESTKSIKITIK